MNNSKIFALMLSLLTTDAFSLHQGPDVWLSCPEFVQFWNQVCGQDSGPQGYVPAWNPEKELTDQKIKDLKQPACSWARKITPMVTVLKSLPPRATLRAPDWACWLCSALFPFFYDRNFVKDDRLVDQSILFNLIYGYNQGREFIPGILIKPNYYARDGILFLPSPRGQFFDLFEDSFWRVLTLKIQWALNNQEKCHSELLLLYLAACSAPQKNSRQQIQILRLKKNKFLKRAFDRLSNVAILGVPGRHIFSDILDFNLQKPTPPVFHSRANLWVQPDFKTYLGQVEQYCGLPLANGNRPLFFQNINLASILAPEQKNFFMTVSLDTWGYEHEVAVFASLNPDGAALEIIIFDSSGTQSKLAQLAAVCLCTQAVVEVFHAIESSKTKLGSWDRAAVLAGLSNCQSALLSNIYEQLRIFSDLPLVLANGRICIL